MSMCPIEL